MPSAAIPPDAGDRRSISVADARGRSVPCAPYRRIVSLVPSLTETLLHVGLRDRLVGRTRFCVHPAPLVRSIAEVGGTKTVDVERVRTLDPDVVVANHEENTEAIVEAVAAIAPVYVTNPRRVAEVVTTLEALARLLSHPNLETCAQAVARAAEACRGRVPASRRAVTLVWRRPFMALGADTYASDLLTLAGATNALAGDGAPPGRYPEVTLDDVARAAPDVVLLPDEPFRFTVAHARALEEALEARAGRAIPCLPLDGELVTWFGVRTLEALAELPRRLAEPSGRAG